MYQGLPAEEELYREVVDLGIKSGAKTLFAKVNAILFLEPGPVPLEELAEKTGYSLASVSNAVKQLETFKHVRRVKQPGSKKIYVQGEKNVIKMLHEQISKSMDLTVRPMRDIMPRIISDLKKDLKDRHLSEEKQQDLKAKIAWYENYLDQNREIEAVFEKVHREFRKCEQEHR